MISDGILKLFTKLGNLLFILNSEYSALPEKRLLKSFQKSGKYPVVDQGQEYISGFSNDKNLVIEVPGPLVVFGDHTRNIKYIDFDFIPGADGTKILCTILIFPRYFYIYLRNYDLKGKGYSRHFKILNENLFAIPPLSEQRRIVEKVDELMVLCDQLKSSLEKAHIMRCNLAENLIEKALK